MGGTLYYGLSDRIGSTGVIVSDSGAKLAEMRYTAWGEVRYQSGSLPTDRTYTGQRSYAYCIKIKCYFDGNVASKKNVTEKFSKAWQYFGLCDDEVQQD